MHGMQLETVSTTRAIQRSGYGELKLSIQAYIGDVYNEKLLGPVQEISIGISHSRFLA